MLGVGRLRVVGDELVVGVVKRLAQRLSDALVAAEAGVRLKHLVQLSPAWARRMRESQSDARLVWELGHLLLAELRAQLAAVAVVAADLLAGTRARRASAVAVAGECRHSGRFQHDLRGSTPAEGAYEALAAAQRERGHAVLLVAAVPLERMRAHPR